MKHPFSFAPALDSDPEDNIQSFWGPLPALRLLERGAFRNPWQGLSMLQAFNLLNWNWLVSWEAALHWPSACDQLLLLSFKDQLPHQGIYSSPWIPGPFLTRSKVKNRHTYKNNLGNKHTDKNERIFQSHCGLALHKRPVKTHYQGKM